MTAGSKVSSTAKHELASLATQPVRAAALDEPEYDQTAGWLPV